MKHEDLEELDVNIVRIKAVLDREYPPGWCVDFSSKPNPGLYYTLEGIFTVRFGNEIYRIPPHCVIAFSDQDRVHLANPTEGTIKMLQFTFWTDDPLYFSRLHIPRVTEDSADGKYLKWFTQASALFTRRPIAYSLGLRIALENILRELILDAAAKSSRQLPKRDQRLTEIKIFIAQHYMQPLTLTDLCVHAHYSSSRLRSIFAEETGLSPMQYLHAVRLNHAKTLLRNSSASIGYIAEKSGFPNVSYFFRVFQRSEGITPAEYRRQYG